MPTIDPGQFRDAIELATTNNRVDDSLPQSSYSETGELFRRDIFSDESREVAHLAPHSDDHVPRYAFILSFRLPKHTRYECG